jgi:hypothetical protein
VRVCCMGDRKADAVRQFINGGPRVEWSLLSRTYIFFVFFCVFRKLSVIRITARKMAVL